MTRVLMRCPSHPTKLIDLSLDLPPETSLQKYKKKTISCPHCGRTHRLKWLFFSGREDEDDSTHWVALDGAPEFAAEVGVLISCSSIIESQIPALLAKITGLPATQARIITGMHRSISSRIDLLEYIAASSKQGRVRTGIERFIPKLRWANNTRNIYAHGTYGFKTPESLGITSFAYDAKKKPQNHNKTVDAIVDEVAKFRSLTNEIHALLYFDKLPEPWK
jgi:hypothetical protein